MNWHFVVHKGTLFRVSNKMEEKYFLQNGAKMHLRYRVAIFLPPKNARVLHGQLVVLLRPAVERVHVKSWNDQKFNPTSVKRIYVAIVDAKVSLYVDGFYENNLFAFLMM